MKSITSDSPFLNRCVKSASFTRRQKEEGGGEKEMTVFDAVKQLELDVFCDVMYGAAKDAKTQDELREKMQAEIPEIALQRINEAALREGYQPLSFSGGQ